MPELQNQLQQLFGLNGFRPSQREVIEDVLRGRDVLCVMPTGAGKSLCFQLPAAMQKGLTVVVSPLISLMIDQVRQMTDEGIAAIQLNSTQSAKEQRAVLNQVADGYEGLFYVSPERFAAPNFQETLSKLKVKLLAIDEAHCISMWGHDFRPDYMRLGAMRQLMKSPPTIALTATATEDVRGDIIRNLHLHDPSIVVTGFDRPNLSYQCRVQNSESKKTEDVIRLLKNEKGSAIVYCSTRKAVDALAASAAEAMRGRCVVAYHAGMAGPDRNEKQEQFMSNAGAVAIATNAFGMGINKPDVRQVIHFNLTGTLEQYYQEAGRAGRDGQHAKCVLFYSHKDVLIQEFFISKLGVGRDDLNVAMVDELRQRATDKLDLMIRFTKAHRCRRQQILDYFGDEMAVENCACDVCGRGTDGDAVDLPPVSDDATLIVRKILSAVARLRGHAGVGTIAEVLIGERSEKVEKRSLQDLSVFGLLKEMTIKPVIAMIHRVIESGLAVQRDFDGQQHFVVDLTATGAAVMKGEQPPPAMLGDIAPGRRKRSIGKKSTGSGTNPRALGVNPRALGVNPRALGVNPRALGVNPRALGVNPRATEDVDISQDADASSRFERLRSLRAKLAQDRQLPAYVVCHDQVLKRIAMEMPESLDSLERIKGMGPMKVKLYGDAILKAVAGD